MRGGRIKVLLLFARGNIPGLDSLSWSYAPSPTGVLLDSDLAALYQVATKALTRAVRRNPGRFPADFMFQLAVEESASLRSQSGALKTGRGKHRKYAPYVFTEQGVAMLTDVSLHCLMWP